MDITKLTPAVFALDGDDKHYFGFHDPATTHSAGLCPVLPRETVMDMCEAEAGLWETLGEASIATHGAHIDLGDLGWTWSSVPMRAGREYFLQPLATREEAEQFVLRLEREGLSFHFDDSAEEVVDGNEQRVFDDAEAAALNARVDELFVLLNDPHEVAIAAVLAAEGSPLYRIERASPYGAAVEQGEGALLEYHTLDTMAEEHPGAESEADYLRDTFTVGERGLFSLGESGFFQITRLT